MNVSVARASISPSTLTVSRMGQRRGCWAGSVPSERASASSSLSSPSRCWGPRPRQRQAAPSRRGTPCTSSSDPAHRPCRTCESARNRCVGRPKARHARGVGVGSRGGAPASRARVDRLRTLATLVRVGGRVHEHAVLWMLAIRERRLARWRSRLVAAAHMRSMRGSAEREREPHAWGRAVCAHLFAAVSSPSTLAHVAMLPIRARFGELRAKEEAAADVALRVMRFIWRSVLGRLHQKSGRNP